MQQIYFSEEKHLQNLLHKGFHLTVYGPADWMIVLHHGRQLIKFLSVEARRAGKLRKKLARVEMWTGQRRISQTITRRIRAYYAEVWLPYTGARTIAATRI